MHLRAKNAKILQISWGHLINIHDLQRESQGPRQVGANITS